MTPLIKDQYRLDIQGLRAIAIMAVLIFHIAPYNLPGGFVGVDMFFVISGFLITQHIARDLNAGTFSFLQFYMKRIRRLYPALLGMIVFTAIGVYLLYLPADARTFGASLMSAAVYASNIFFYTQSGYFDDKIHSNPLLHTWSLSVEEQFYIVFPLILFLIYKYARTNLFLIVAVLGVVAFAFSEIVLRMDPSAAFYWSITRFGQFIAGALIALATPCALNKLGREAMSWAGLALMGASIVFFSKDTPFPGLMSIVPTLGTALVIYAGTAKEDMISSKILALSPFQFLGNISYSLYLWHWPIVLFYKYALASEIRTTDKGIVFVLCVIAGYASWRFIEKPGLKVDFTKPAFPRGALAATILMIGLGASFMMTDGYKQRFPKDLQSLSDYIDYEYKTLAENCSLSGNNQSADDFDVENCMATQEGKTNILLIGDSHAAHFYSALQQEFPEAHIAQATSSGCRPLLGTEGTPLCKTFRDRLFTQYLPQYKYDMIIVSGRWRDAETPKVQETVAALRQYTPRILISGPVLEYSGSLPRLMGISYLRGDDGRLIDKARKYDKAVKTDSLMRTAAKEADAAYFSPFESLCPNGEQCRIEAAKGIPMQFDGAHLTHDGARIMAVDMRRQRLLP